MATIRFNKIAAASISSIFVLGTAAYTFETEIDSFFTGREITQDSKGNSVIVKNQDESDLHWEGNGHTYKIMAGMVVDAIPVTRVNKDYAINLSHVIYDFDNEVIIYAPAYTDTSNIGVLFADANQENIERIRNIGCEIAKAFIERQNDPEYQNAPDSVLEFNDRHCHFSMEN